MKINQQNNKKYSILKHGTAFKNTMTHVNINLRDALIAKSDNIEGTD